MDCQSLWLLFRATGLPEVYALLALARRAEEARVRDKSA